MLVLGHRGAPREVPENTVAGVRAALAAGADGVEVDVRRTADGALVCSHDSSLARLGGPTTPVCQLTIADLDAVRIGGEPVAGLEAVLDAARGRGRVVVEVKNMPGEPDFDAPQEATAHAVAALLADRAAGPEARDDIVVSSFDWFAVEAVRDAAPGVRTGFLTPPGLAAAAAIGYAREARLAEWHPHWSTVAADPTSVADAHAAGLAVVCWTVDDAETAAELAGWGVDAVISNGAGDLVAALRPRR